MLKTMDDMSEKHSSQQQVYRMLGQQVFERKNMTLP